MPDIVPDDGKEEQRKKTEPVKPSVKKTIEPVRTKTRETAENKKIAEEKEEEKLKKELAEAEKEQAQQDAQQAHEDAAIAKSRSNTKIVTVPRKSSGSSSSHSDSGTPMTVNYDVNVRSAPSKDATQVDYIYSGTTVNIIKTVQNGNETWGQIGDDRWVCINDGNLTIIS